MTRMAMARGTASEAWPVNLEPAEDGGYVVNFPDLPNGWSQGEDKGNALRQAEDLLEEMILSAMAHNEDVALPSPAAGRPLVPLPALAALGRRLIVTSDAA